LWNVCLMITCEREILQQKKLRDGYPTLFGIFYILFTLTKEKGPLIRVHREMITECLKESLPQLVWEEIGVIWQKKKLALNKPIITFYERKFVMYISEAVLDCRFWLYIFSGTKLFLKEWIRTRYCKNYSTHQFKSIISWWSK